MKNWKKKIIGYIFASLMIVFGVLHLITKFEWAQELFVLSLCALSLYNLFLNPFKNENGDEN